MQDKIKELWNGERVKSDYFDMTFYKNAGTFHLFPNRSDLIDRINIIVGSHRQWLPHDPSDASEAFWQQYKKAEKVNTKLKIDDVLIRKAEHGDDQSTEVACKEITSLIRLAQLSCGIDYQPELIEKSFIKKIA